MSIIKNAYKVTPALALVLAVGCQQASDIPSDSDIASSYNTENSDNTSIAVPSREVDPIKPMPTVAKPSSGLYTQNLDGQQAIAPLEIRTESGSDYYVKVVNAANDNDTLAIYIHGGETVEVEVPLGNYEIRYASGTNWYGDQELFGSDTAFNKADELFNFVDTGYQISGYTITLYQVIDGNLQTKTIDKNQF